MQHANARLTPRGRLELVRLVEKQGFTLRAPAAARSVSVSRAWVWVTRWRRATPAQRVALACLGDRSSRPHRQPRRLGALEQARIVLARRRRGWGPRLLAGELGMAHSTVGKVLRRHGLSRPQRSGRGPVRR